MSAKMNYMDIPAFPASGFAVTPSDATVFKNPTALYVNGEGNVVVEPWNGGATLTFGAMPIGSIVPLTVRRVLAATTATVIGLF